MLRNIESEFNGFSPETLVFLQNLKANNNHAWFEAYREDYQKYLLEPMRNLVAELGEFMLMIDPDFEITPAVNKTISRIYRDTRFSKDKSPFRARMWITFKRPIKDWQDSPAYFFEIAYDSYCYGMGFYRASKDTMDHFREMIDKRIKEFRKAIAFYSKQRIFILEGEKYKRILGKEKPKEIQDWYQRKNLYFITNRKLDKRLFKSDLIDDLISGFWLLAPFYHFLWETKSRR